MIFVNITSYLDIGGNNTKMDEQNKTFINELDGKHIFSYYGPTSKLNIYLYNYKTDSATPLWVNKMSTMVDMYSGHSYAFVTVLDEYNAASSNEITMLYNARIYIMHIPS